MAENTIPLDSVIIDERSEEIIAQQARVRVFNESGSTLNDFSENSPLAALIQGQAFAAAELLYYVNKLPLALVIDFLKVTGVERNLGTKAKVTLTFTIAAPQSVPFNIPQGFEVVDDSGVYSFLTDNLLQIPVGLISGSVTATAEEVGSVYNSPAYSITNITQPLAFLTGVTNTEAASGGTDLEEVADTITRALNQIRLRNLVSANDYEQAAEALLGNGSVAKAIGLLGKDKTTRELGAVHLFLLNADGQPANSAQLSYIKSQLSESLQLGTSLYTSPMEQINISGEMIARLVVGVDPEEAFTILWEAYQEYLNPTSYSLGQDLILNEVEYTLRNTGVISEINYLILNGNTLNIPLVNEYTLPSAYSLFMQLVGVNGVRFDKLLGAGESPEFGGFV